VKSPTFLKATFLKRYKRFLVDVLLDSGEIVVAHTSNTGSMLSCLEENAPILISQHDNPLRKTKFTWELIKINGTWIGVNTQKANDLAELIIKNNLIPHFFPDFTLLKREWVFNDSRFDMYIENQREKCFLEVKNVSYKHENGAFFPDAISKRGQKHLIDLMKARKQNYRAVMFYIIQRNDVNFFAPAAHIDKAYAELFWQAVSEGVEVYPIRMSVSPEGIHFDKVLPLIKSFVV